MCKGHGCYSVCFSCLHHLVVRLVGECELQDELMRAFIIKESV